MRRTTSAFMEGGGTTGAALVLPLDVAERPVLRTPTSVHESRWCGFVTRFKGREHSRPSHRVCMVGLRARCPRHWGALLPGAKVGERPDCDPACRQDPVG